MSNKPFMFIVYGPTGVGKSDFAVALAEQIPAEIINMDVGQFYTPFSIGTAKPAWRESAIPHHFFDIIDEPKNYTVSEYRKALYQTVHEICSRGKLPILVGGSGYYLHALLFPPQVAKTSGRARENSENENLWQELFAIDPERAAQIDKNDTYRIERALHIWHTTGNLPSHYKPVYKPELDYLLLFVERDREELKKRIDVRVHQMLESGWIAETEKIIDTPWKDFIRKKNLIGYNEIVDYLAGKKTMQEYQQMVTAICTKTKQYAKRQFTFWRKLEREIKKEKQYTGTNIGCIETVNLSTTSIHAYSSSLLQRLAVR